MVTDQALAALAREAGLATPSIVVRRLLDGREAVVDARRGLYPASMIKVPLATALFAEAGRSLTERVAVADVDMTTNDAASPLQPGYEATLGELARLMLTRSDNVATNVLITTLGRQRATEYAQRLGLRDTFVRRKLSGASPLIDDPEATGRNAHPAADAALLFERIARQTIPGAAWLHDALLAQEWNEKLPRGLRPSDRFAHKTGDTDEVTHDGGILQTAGGERYVIVVYTSLSSSPDGDARLASFMATLRPLLR